MNIQKRTSAVLIVLQCTTILLCWSSFTMKVNGEKICNTMEVINNNIEKLEKLKDCEVIHGSLTMAKISLENITEYNLSVREITGYLLIYRIEYLESLETLFPNLTLIRGVEKYLDYSLIIFENSNLLNVGLKNLIRITDGSIRITKNPQLCYVYTINWIEILSNVSQQHYIIKTNRNNNHCAICRELKQNEKYDVYNEQFCWKYNEFQKVCKEDGNKFKQKLQSCCTEDCLSSCTLDIGLNSTFCSVCKNFKDQDGKCTSNCGPSFYELNNRRCVTADSCKLSQLIPFQGKCIKTCPDGYIQADNELKCIKCLSNTCPKHCIGNFTIFTETDAKTLKGCTRIDGYLEIELKPKNTKIIALLERHLTDIEEITGYLKISKSPQIKTLKFLKNLLTVDGNILYENKYSLYVYDNFNLETLWEENQKIAFLNGTAFFHLNPKFCIDYISNLSLKIIKNIKEMEDKFEISNGYDTYCTRSSFETNVEEVSVTAARIKIKPFMHSNNKITFLGYMYYYIEAPSQNISIFDSFHGCGHDNWQMGISLGLNTRYILNNLKPNTQYAYFVRTFTILNYHIKLNAISDIDYFTTKNIDDRPSPIKKLFFNVINSTAIELFWWPPTNTNNGDSSIINDTNNSYYIAVNYTIISMNSFENTTKINNNSPSCQLEYPFKWRGLNPKETDYYKREQFLVEDLLPDYLFLQVRDNKIEDGEQEEVEEKVEPEIVDGLATLFPKSAKYDQEMYNRFWTFVNETEKNFIKEQNEGAENFKLPQIYKSSLNTTNKECCSITCTCLKSIRTDYLIRNLNPSTWYKITLKVCNKLNVCSTATYIKAKTMNNLQYVI